MAKVARKKNPSIEEMQEALLRKSFEKMVECFDSDEPDMDSARMALKTAELVTKREGTALHRHVLQFSILQAIHRDPEKLAQAAEKYRPDLKKLTA